MRPAGWAGLLLALVVARAQAELPSFEDFFRRVSECSLDMRQYHGLELVEPGSEGVLISLPTSGAVRGFLISAFYFSPGRSIAADRYGLLFNAPIEAIARAFPEFAEARTVNGHLQRLSRLSEQTGEDTGRRQTLLMCTGGVAV